MPLPTRTQQIGLVVWLTMLVAYVMLHVYGG
jgi:hypothetical protein